jgi:hypothetical protein
MLVAVLPDSGSYALGASGALFIKVASTAQFIAAGPVVYVFPINVPPQPLTRPI